MTRGKKILIGLGAAIAAFLLLGVGGAIGTEREVVLDSTLEAEIATLTAHAEADTDKIATDATTTTTMPPTTTTTTNPMAAEVEALEERIAELETTATTTTVPPTTTTATTTPTTTASELDVLDGEVQASSADIEYPSSLSETFDWTWVTIDSIDSMDEGFLNSLEHDGFIIDDPLQMVEAAFNTGRWADSLTMCYEVIDFVDSGFAVSEDAAMFQASAVGWYATADTIDFIGFCLDQA